MAPAPTSAVLGATSAPTRPTPPPTSALSDGSSDNSTPPTLALMISLALAGLALMVVRVQRRSIRR